MNGAGDYMTPEGSMTTTTAISSSELALVRSPELNCDGHHAKTTTTSPFPFSAQASRTAFRPTSRSCFCRPRRGPSAGGGSLGSLR